MHNKEICDLYSSPSISRIIKLRMRWEGHVARMGEMTTYRLEPQAKLQYCIF
jgi:hypothetical protein